MGVWKLAGNISTLIIVQQFVAQEYNDRDKFVVFRKFRLISRVNFWGSYLGYNFRMNIYPSIVVRLINDPLRDDIEYVTTYIYLVHLKYINESTNTTCTAGTKM